MNVSRPANESVPDELCVATASLFNQLAGVVAALPLSRFTEKSGPQFMGATVGGHVRHCLDHAQAILTINDGEIDYDNRVRGTIIELDPHAAAQALCAASERLLQLSRAAIPGPVYVRITFCSQGASTRVASSFHRECAFVLSHTVHHMAMIRGMLFQCDISVPREFGYAPATLHALAAISKENQ